MDTSAAQPDASGEELAASADGVANALEAACLVAHDGGLDVVGALGIAFAFDPSGDVTVTVTGDDGKQDSAVVTAADIAARSDLAEDRESVPPAEPA